MVLVVFVDVASSVRAVDESGGSSIAVTMGKTRHSLAHAQSVDRREFSGNGWGEVTQNSPGRDQNLRFTTDRSRHLQTVVTSMRPQIGQHLNIIHC